MCGSLYTVNNQVRVPKIYFFLLTKTISGFLPTLKWVDHTHCSGRELKPEEGEIQFWSICYPNDVAIRLGGVWTYLG